MTSPLKLAGYHLDHRLAVGGMAEIFRARRVGPEGFSKQVAIKVVLPDLCRDPSFVEMFLQEARLSARLSSEQLVQVFDFGQEQGRYFLVMEYVEGADLATLLSTAGPLPYALALHISRQLCAALAYLHQAEGDEGEPLQIVHRDVTPGNILLSTRGAIKLGDFGIARWQAQRVRTSRGNIKGTLAYLSPEQARGDEVDRRTDLYGLGLVLFEMLTGQRYLQAKDDPGLLRVAQEPPPSAPSSCISGLPPEMDAILARALAPEPARRFPTAELFDQALAQISTDLQGAAASAALGALVQESRRLTAVDDDTQAPPEHEPELVGESERPSPAPARHTEVMGGTPAARSRPGRTLGWVAAGVLALMGVGGIWWAARDQPTPRGAPASEQAGNALSRPAVTASTAANESGPRGPKDSGPDHPASHPDQKSVAIPAVTVDQGSPRPARRVRSTAAAPPRADASPPLARDASPPKNPRATPSTAPAQITTLRRQLTARGLLPADAPALYRDLAALAAAKRDGALAASAIDALGDRIRSFSIHRPFIEAKLRRLNGKLDRSNLSAGQREVVRQHTSRALSFVVTGRYEEANQELNHIARLL